MMITLFGILLPLVALGFEVVGHPCADMWIDPIPSHGHTLLIATVPLTCTLYLIGRRDRTFDFLSGLATAVAACYAVVFAPFTPLGVVGILFYGLGLLILSPMLSVFALLQVRQGVGRWDIHWLGAFAGLVGLVGFLVPGLVTRSWMSTNSVVQLRAFGDRQTMRKLCEDSTEARRTYFEATGEVYEESVPRIEGLRQSVSKIEGTVDPDAALAYLEWTFELENKRFGDQEAMMEIGLPAGAVVSRATLWVNGEEREAAYTSPEKATKAYESVVYRPDPRDPLLVKSSGPGRVEVRCFPVPSNGKIKFKLGITTPLSLASRSEAWLETPRILRSNFEPMRNVTLSYANALSVLRLPTCIRFQRDPRVLTAWTPLKEGGFAVERLRPQFTAERIALVVDTSLGMRPHWSEVVQAAEALRPERIYFPTDAQPAEATSLEKATCAGGRNNLPALHQALQHYQTVVWVHARQPYAISNLDAVKGLLKDRELIEVSLEPGGDAVLQELQLPSVRPLSRRGTLAQDLEALRQSRLEFQVGRVKRQPEGVQTNDHLARLWALQNDKALAYHLVTPTTSAVVLETKEQFEANGLTPVTDDIPSVPEPGTLALVGTTLAAAGLAEEGQSMLRHSR